MKEKILQDLTKSELILELKARGKLIKKLLKTNENLEELLKFDK